MTVTSDEEIEPLMDIPRLAIPLKVAGSTLRVGDAVEVPPCLKDSELEDFRKARGRECPKIDLEPENAVPYEVFRMLIREDSRDWSRVAFQDLTEGMHPLMRKRMRRRIFRTLLDREVTEKLHPPPKDVKR
jgi:hypothetical protein